MKLSITDQFLQDLYYNLEKADDIAYFVFRRRRTFYDILPSPKRELIRKYQKIKGRNQFNKFIYYLKKNNYIKIKKLKGKEAILLTKKGKDKAFKASFKLSNILQKRNDGKWIMIIFDIPQKQWKARNLLKSVLHNLNYKKFQQSVWVTPYDVSEKTEDLLQYYSLEKYVRVFLIEQL